MRKTLTATLLAAALFAADPAREQTLQRAIDLMESKGDFAKALPLFEEAARSADKALAARALLYLGQGQERQSTERARPTYERIVKEFSAQTETADAARKRLAAFGTARSSEALTARLLCRGCPAVDGSALSDGRRIAITDWSSGDLAIRDISTGQLKRLMAKTGSWDDSSAYAEFPLFSPDMRHVVYHWSTGETRGHHPQLRVMANEAGAKARVLLDNPENTYYTPAAWSPDGKSVLLEIEKPDRTWQLAWVSVADGAVKTLKSLGWRTLETQSHPTLSPDGRYIAYAALATNPDAATRPPASADRRIYILAADGSSEETAVKTGTANQNPVWTPDGRHLLFMSDRSASLGLWSVPIENGKASGPHRLVMANTGPLTVNGMMRSGSLYYSTSGVDVESIGITQRGSVAKVDDSLAGIRPIWSPDGKMLAFKRRRASGSGDTLDLVVHTLETGEQTVYSHPGIMPGLGEWTADGSGFVVWIAPPQGGTRGLHRVDLKTKEFTPLLEVGVEVIRATGQHPTFSVSTVSPDGNTIYAAAPDLKDNKVMSRIVAVGRKTGQIREVIALAPTGQINFKLSPDGRTLAIRRQDTPTGQTVFARVAIDGSGYRELHRARGLVYRLEQFAWARDGSGILFAAHSDDRSKWQILKVPVEGGKPEPTGFEVKDTLQNMSLSPDGARIAFSATKPAPELWAIDNISSVLK